MEIDYLVNFFPKCPQIRIIAAKMTNLAKKVAIPDQIGSGQIGSGQIGSGQLGSGRIRQANVARILDAAERVFAESGFAGATMAQIAAASGLPKANLHYYFGTTDALYPA